MSQITLLALDGLTCGHCVKRVKETLEKRQDVELAEVSIDAARISGDASADQLIATIEQAGYHARVAQDGSHPKADPLTDSETQPEALTADDATLPAESFHLLIDGMSCASCVSRVQHALQEVDGVSQARVNLAERSALVLGSAQPQSLIDAVTRAGYGAEIIEDDVKRREKQQQSAQAAVQRFRWQAALALALGIPLMLWGMVGDNMMLSATNRSGWLMVGVVTLLVMAIAGGHFYRSAWKSLRNRTATMDTLVALGTAAAWLYSMAVNLWPDLFPMAARHLYYEASAMIIGLINLGHMLEQRARQRSSQALEKLLDLTPPTARVVTDRGEQTLALSAVTLGMTLRVNTGDRVRLTARLSRAKPGWTRPC